jgi:DNA-directed RNA polymerase specialized sigma24 family protein
VLALDEPWRSAVLWRFFHDLQPRVIAARLGVPVATVRSRVQRGLELLRTELLPRAGLRDPDLRALAPLLPWPRLARTAASES